MKSITVEQVKILVDRILTLKSDQIETESTNYGRRRLRVVQATFAPGQHIKFHFKPGDDELIITIVVSNRNYFDRKVDLPTIRIFSGYYRQWRRLSRNIEKRLSNRAFSQAEQQVAQVSQAIGTLFPDIIEKELLDLK